MLGSSWYEYNKNRGSKLELHRKQNPTSCSSLEAEGRGNLHKSIIFSGAHRIARDFRFDRNTDNKISPVLSEHEKNLVHPNRGHLRWTNISNLKDFDYEEYPLVAPIA